MLRRSLLIVLLVIVLSGCYPVSSSVTRNNQGEKQVSVVSAQQASASEAEVSEAEVSEAEVSEAEVSAPGAAVAGQVGVSSNVPVEELEANAIEEATVDAAPVPTATVKSPTQTAQSRPAAQVQPAAMGPDKFPENVNPLTGLPVENIENLSLSPALVSVTNFPVTARPQAGLSYSPFVFEMYIGEGMTRFLALFYGDYPKVDESGAAVPSGESIGPVRSGRLPYESLRQLYNGFLVMASASPNVKSSLGSFANIWGNDTGDINSAMIPVSKLETIAQNSGKAVDQGMLSGLRFEQSAPADGKLGNMLWIPYSFLNQVMWRYDAASGAYLRYQDAADGKTFVQATDRLNGDPLAYENVVVLFATHHARAETLIDIDLMYIDRMPALLFRDGKMYELFWTTANADYEKRTGHVRPVRFVDAQGNPFPLKPGQTWVEIVQPYTKYNETVDSEVYMDLRRKTDLGSGNWAVHFYPTVPEVQ